jgi:hypothetical protein
MSDEAREFRLRPGTPPVAKQSHGTASWSSAFKTLMHYARQSRRGAVQSSSGGRRGFSHRQRCAVRITYAKNATRGLWGAHGRYLERDSALGGETGFDAKETAVNVSGLLHHWQSNKDELLWKLIISPEFGERADLQKLTRDLMTRVEEDLGGPLDWVAVVHRNTEHPHVHVALRGVDAKGATLRLSRDYVRRGFREIAEDLCTRQMGFRTILDTADAERREINEMRFTSLDRVILRGAQPGENGLVFNNAAKHHLSARLIVLSRMGIAEGVGNGEWRLRPDMEQVLRAMQRSADRQKTLAAHGELVSDKRLQVEVVNWRQVECVEGRVLVHGEEENSGQRYLMIEAITGKIFYIPYSSEMEDARRRGELNTNAFIRLRKLFDGEMHRLEIQDYGPADAVLTNHRLLREKAQEARQHGIEPSDDGWAGWLGRYQKALCQVGEGRCVEQGPNRMNRRSRPQSSPRER